MRAPLAFLAAVACAACSGSNDAGTAADASIAPSQPLGAACDPAHANPCAPAPTLCSANVCTSGVCTQVLTEGTCRDVAAPPPAALCATSADCDGGVCGFLANAGCSVTGVCLVPVDAGPLPTPACGCDGHADPYVAEGFTGAPASGTGACVDAGAGADAGVDAGADAEVDAAADAGGDAGNADAGDAAPE